MIILQSNTTYRYTHPILEVVSHLASCLVVRAARSVVRTLQITAGQYATYMSCTSTRYNKQMIDISGKAEYGAHRTVCRDGGPNGTSWPGHYSYLAFQYVLHCNTEAEGRRVVLSSRPVQCDEFHSPGLAGHVCALHMYICVCNYLAYTYSYVRRRVLRAAPDTWTGLHAAL